MAYDPLDTIAAIASASGGAARGIVRVSGPRALECVAACWSESGDRVKTVDRPVRCTGIFRAAGNTRDRPLLVPGDLFLWPGERSYTRQPAAEFHTIGSPPVLAAMVEELCRRGARPAQQGEFTLRAFLAGRLDLVQAEAVLGVVDARTRGDLDAALDQLAGGLSRPLWDLRDRLLHVLAELEAGLDFAEEPIEFIGREEVRRRLREGQRLVAATMAQLSERQRPGEVPRVALSGPPNVGKSSLFNALVDRHGEGTAATSLVSPTPGATRDFVTARIRLDGVPCELIDLAGEDRGTDIGAIDQAAQHAAHGQRRQAELRLRCFELAGGNSSLSLRERARLRENLVHASPSPFPRPEGEAFESPDREILVATKCDLSTESMSTATTRSPVYACSSVTGAGLDELGLEIRRRLVHLASDGGGVASTAARCSASLREAERALGEAENLSHAGGDELLAAEIRAALGALGEVVGAVSADDVLDRIFSQFCIGK